MRKILLSTIFVVCFVVALASVYLVINPPAVLAEEGGTTARCKDGTTVSCSGATCYAIDATPEADGWCQCDQGDPKFCKPLLD